VKYSGSSDTDLIPGTDVLRNIPGITDQDKLVEFERNIVAWRSVSLPVGNFNAAHLKAVHRHLFQDVYPWAGEFRQVPLAKGESRFAQPQFIEQETQRVLKETFLLLDSHKDGSDICAVIANCIIELIAVHPFCEGNGRVIRAFIEQAMAKFGYSIQFAGISEARWLNASIQGFRGDESAMLQLLREITSSQVNLS
jgi:cell filamentation protein